MEVRLDSTELSLIPDSDDERSMLKEFASIVETSGDGRLAMATLDGVNLDELVVQPFCKGGASHCQLCGKSNAD